MRLALYEPDIPQNAGSLLRLDACLGVGIDIIEPCGFLLTDRNFRRAGLDYHALAEMRRHASWAQFAQSPGQNLLALLTTKASQPYTDFAFRADDTLLLGRESAGVPPVVHDAAGARLCIPLRPGPSVLECGAGRRDGAGRGVAPDRGLPRSGRKGLFMHLTLFESGGLLALGQVLMIDIVLAGDNAVVIGMAAGRVAPEMRRKVIFWGLAAAVLLRVGLAMIAVSLMAVIGLTLAGGILLLWVCWRMWRDLRTHRSEHVPEISAGSGLRQAITQIIVADISMSLDNVLGVAGAARGHLDVLVIGLLLSVALMGAAAEFIARIIERIRWIAYIGLLIVLYVAIKMIYDGGHEVMGAIL